MENAFHLWSIFSEGCREPVGIAGRLSSSVKSIGVLLPPLRGVLGPAAIVSSFTWVARGFFILRFGLDRSRRRRLFRGFRRLVESNQDRCGLFHRNPAAVSLERPLCPPVDRPPHDERQPLPQDLELNLRSGLSSKLLRDIVQGIDLFAFWNCRSPLLLERGYRPFLVERWLPLFVSSPLRSRGYP